MWDCRSGFLLVNDKGHDPERFNATRQFVVASGFGGEGKRAHVV